MISQSQKSRRNNSEILSSENLRIKKEKELNISITDPLIQAQISEVQSNLSLESFSELIKNNHNTLNDFNHTEELLELSSNKNINTPVNQQQMRLKAINKNIIKYTIQRFHELFLKMANKIITLNKEIHIKNIKLKIDNTEEYDSENLTVMSIKQQELDCFNDILFQFNLHINDLHSEQESIQKDILKKYKEIEKLNNELLNMNNTKKAAVKELQDLALKINEYKTNNHIGIISSSLYKFDSNDVSNNFNSACEEEILDEKDFLHLVNKDNKEKVMMRLMNENKKIRNVLMTMKNNEIELASYFTELQLELENLNKFKNVCLVRISSIEEENLKLREKLEYMNDKLSLIELKIEITEE